MFLQSSSSSSSIPILVLSSFFYALQPVLGCGHDLHLFRRQRTDTWQSAAQATNPTVTCAPYSYAPVQSVLKSYPTIWEIASLSQPGIDPQAIELYQKFGPTIPNIQPKGTPTGDFNATTPNYPRTDPDCWWSFSRCTTPKLNGLAVDVSSCPEPSTWGLSIDDGPNCSHNAYYDFLRQSNQKATLFYIGSNVIDWPLEAQRGLADGHEICAHTWSHRYMTALTNEQAFAELYFSKRILKDVMGITVQCWRPPFGDVDDRIRYIAAGLGMSTILWDNDVNDFRFATLGQAAVNGAYQKIIDGATRGDYNTHGTIVLSHELNADTMATSQAFLPKISQAFKFVAPVAVCQNNTHPYLEKQYSYPTFTEWMGGTRVKQAMEPVVSPGSTLRVPIRTSNSANLTQGDAYTSSNSEHGRDGAKGAGERLKPRSRLAVIGGIVLGGLILCCW